MIRGSLFTVGLLIGLASLGWGAISIMAGGMSDDTSAGNEAATSGLWTMAVGIPVAALICFLAWAF